MIQERVHDTYALRTKLSEPCVCPGCEAVYRKGRWVWADRPSGAAETLCPACRRIRDHYPAGYVRLEGKFVKEHRDEILNLIQNLASQEQARHPMKRILALERPAGGGVWVKTTDMHLARQIGEAIHRAYDGSLSFDYPDEASLLRVRWTR